MIKRYPLTVRTLGVLAFLGVVAVAIALWQPLAYVFVGLLVVLLIAEAVSQDRKPKP